MNKKYFVHHCHSDFSLLDSSNKPSNIVKRIKELGLDGCAITDHNSISGAVVFTKLMSKAGLKPIIGCEFNIANNKEDRSNTHLLLLSKNIEGWKSLIRITSESNKRENYYYKPRLTLEQMAPFVKSLVGISGHPGSTLASSIFSNFNDGTLNPNWKADGIRLAKTLEDIFGNGNFFIEIQLIDSPFNKNVIVLADCLREISKETGIKCVATPDAHYARHEDAEDQRVLLCTNLNTTFREINNKIRCGEDFGLSSFFTNNNYHIPSYDEMVEYGNTEEELENTLKVADVCEQYSLSNPPQIPKYPTPDNKSSPEYLLELCREGWKKRWPKIQQVIAEGKHTKEEYGERVKTEYEVFGSFPALSDYMLIVRDICNYADSQGQLRGPARGSAAGCLLLYLLEVTEVDPIKNELLFTRFFNPGRLAEGHISLPDIDTDFQPEFRESILNYIRDRFGHDKVGQIITFGRLQGRSCLKDTLRAHSACSFEEMNQMTTDIPDEAAISDKLEEMRQADKEAGGEGEASIIEWSLQNYGESLKQYAYLDDEGNIHGPFAKYFEQAIRLEGTKRNCGKHAAGIFISPEPLIDCCPMVYDKSGSELISGLSMNDLEEIGFVKLDILGVNSLSIISNTIKLLKE